MRRRDNRAAILVGGETAFNPIFGRDHLGGFFEDLLDF
jgi:hypothetical protein